MFVQGPVANGADCHWYEIPVPADCPDPVKVTVVPEHPEAALKEAIPALGAPVQAEATVKFILPIKDLGVLIGDAKVPP